MKNRMKNRNLKGKELVKYYERLFVREHETCSLFDVDRKRKNGGEDV